MDIQQLMIFWGIPGAITGLVFWLLKKYIDNRIEQTNQHEKNIEKLLLMQIRMNQATNLLAAATAKAIRKISEVDSDVDKALEKALQIEEEEKEFLFSQGIQNIV